MPFGQGPLFGGRLFVHVRSDPYALITPITRTIRRPSADQPVERAATLEDVRAEVLTPDRLNAMVFGGFALVALTIAVVGVAGVLAFSVSARTREFGIRLAIGSQPRHLLTQVIAEGTVMTAAGIGAGLAAGLALQQAGRHLFRNGADAGSVGGGGGGGHLAGGGGGGVGVAGDASGARGCDPGFTGGLGGGCGGHGLEAYRTCSGRRINNPPLAGETACPTQRRSALSMAGNVEST